MLHFVPGELVPFTGRGRKLGLGSAMLPHPLRLLAADTALGSNPGQSTQGLALLVPLARTCSDAQGRGLQFQPPCLCAASTVYSNVSVDLKAVGIVGILGRGLLLYWKGRRCLLKLLPRQSPVCVCLYFCSTENSGVLTDEYLSTPNFSICSKHPACFLSSLPHQFCTPQPQQSDLSPVHPKVMSPGEPEEKTSHIWL